MSSHSYVRFTPEEIQYIGEHSASTRVIQLARYFGCDRSSIRYQIKLNGFPTYQSFRNNPEIASEFIRLFNTDMPHSEIAQKFGISPVSVQQTAYQISQKFGLARIPHRRGRRPKSSAR